MLEKINENNCVGCSACMQACPVYAINMVSNEKGFLYPEIDSTKCVSCGYCEKVCQCYGVENINLGVFNPSVFTFTSNDKLAYESTSGGVSYELTKAFLKNNDIVFGSVFKNHRAIHQEIEDISSIQKSKYIQSEVGHTYNEVRTHLFKNRKVLYIGTPCQIAGLYKFLRKNFENLYTVDLICFGVPSPKLFDAYIKYEEQKSNDEIISIDFRDKSKGWNNPSTKISFLNKVKVTPSTDNPFYKVFLSHLAIRESCGTCPYASVKRISDLSIGDFWGIENKNIMVDLKKGVSKVLVNTKKGEELFNTIKIEGNHSEVPLVDAIRPNLIAPCELPEVRHMFFNDFISKGFEYSYNRYVKEKLPKRILISIKKMTKKIIGCD